MLPSPLLRLLARAVHATVFLLPFSVLGQGVVTLQLDDYATVPQSGSLIGTTDNAVYVARVNFLREEPGGGLNRLWVCDLNGKLYIVDKTTKQFATYLDFQRNTSEIPGATGLFAAFTRNAGYANGLVTFQFDPDYRNPGPNFGKFYTVHIEVDTNDGDTRRLPNASAHPGFTNAASYTPSTAHEAPGTDNANTRHAVLIEWQDTNPGNTTFEGTARELLRIEFNGRIHPMGDLAFNPRAVSASDPDWRKMYIAVGDGGAGEQNNATLHPTPQRLDVLQGKILRISPDDPDGAGPERYGIPNDNPFTGPATTVPAGTRPEIWAYGFRNPHRISFDPLSSALIAADIGFHSWEEVNVVRRGANYGWGDREGTWVLNVVSGNADVALPANDASNGYVYPVLQYPHSPALGVGDAVAGGFVYRGTIAELRGKYIFGDITTGELFYADLVEMISADDGNPATLARFNKIELLWDNPRDAAPAQRYNRMYEIVENTYHARGGTDANLPGSATVSDLTGGGRADIRLAVDQAGELFVLSKSDGMIRTLRAAPAPTAAPVLASQPVAQSVATGATVAFSVEATNAASYQWRRNNTPISGATNATLTLTGVTAADAANYSVAVTNAAGTTVSSAANLGVVTTSDPGRIINFSIRSAAGTGASTLIVGFATNSTGNTSGEGQTLLLRGIGPALGMFGLTGFLPDPRLDVFRGNTRITENDNWEIAGGALAAAQQVGAFALPRGSRDAALVQTALPVGSYTMQITAVPGSGGNGIALAEIFDATPAGTGVRELVNVSARAPVSAGEGTLIAGFVLGGSTARTVLIRGAGPALTNFGLSGTLADPKLTLFRGDTRVAENDNWSTSADMVNTFTSVGAFQFVARTRDAVLYTTLEPDLYTAQVSGLGTANGIALIEVYILP